MTLKKGLIIAIVGLVAWLVVTMFLALGQHAVAAERRRVDLCPATPEPFDKPYGVIGLKAVATLVVHQWTYGPWDASACSTKTKVTRVWWGGEPSGSTNPVVGWSWLANDSKITWSANSDTMKGREWRGHFHYSGGIGPLSQDMWPILRIKFKPNQVVETYSHI